MKSIYNKIILCLLLGIIGLDSNVYAAASISISAPSSVIVGNSCTITITGNGAATYDVVAKISGAGISETIYLNAYTDDLQNGTKSASKVVVPKTTGTITVSIEASSNVTVSGGTGSQKISTSPKTISVVEQPKADSTPTTPTPSQTTTTPKKTNTNTNKTTTPKTEEPKEEKQDDFYINKVVLTGVKESGEKVDISLSPEFQRDTYEYTCHVGAEIQKLELEKEAGDYTNSIIVTGLDDLKEGENSITLQLAAEDHEAKTYTIKVIKETQETIETIVPIDENLAKTGIAEIKTISMPLWVFIVMQILIIMIEVLAIYFIPWKNLFKKEN